MKLLLKLSIDLLFKLSIGLLLKLSSIELLLKFSIFAPGGLGGPGPVGPDSLSLVLLPRVLLLRALLEI
jgi:hypothetical protein